MSTQTTAVDHTPRTPLEAWRALQDGNARFIAGQTEHPHQDAQRRKDLAQSQKPFAVIFGCSDSRLAAEIIFDLGLGDTFVIRTAGQVIDNAVLGSLEYAIEVLGTPLIMVLGHDSCGAVTATKDSVESGQLPRGFQRDLVERITPSVLEAKRAGDADLQDMVVEHTRQTAARLMDHSAAISTAVTRGDAAVIGVFYHLADGKAELVYSEDPAFGEA
ncbi:carbonic anhydrase [Kocuria rhizophila]|uniref:carbonic anhydrase n=1 Tax=Kocuria rhizophila TaxID=72000 RepID=UPI0025B1C1A8|nr:carbonic anhydrase [Kocuria rhizophila]MDN3225829.1 carbonic anhydrase [Kocuria rhizophila]